MSDEFNFIPKRSTEDEKERLKKRVKEDSIKLRKNRQGSHICPDCNEPKDGDNYRCSKCREKRDNNICLLCDKPSSPGFVKCLEHIIIEQKNKKEKYGECIANGLCIQCNKPAAIGSTLCNRHINKRDNLRNKINTKINAGICRYCNKASTEGFSTCAECRLKKGTLAKNKSSQHLLNGLCNSCSRPKLPNIKVCKLCYLKRIASQNGLTVSGWVDLEALWNKQNGKCAYSGESLIMGLNASLDHIHPICKNGTSELSNLQWVTKEINTIKRDLSHERFLELIKIISQNLKLIGDNNG